MQSGQLNLGAKAVTVISVPPGTAHHIAFGADNGFQHLPPARLRVAIHGPSWYVKGDVTVNGEHGQTVVTFPNPARTGVISVTREDNGKAAVGYVVY